MHCQLGRKPPKLLPLLWISSLCQKTVMAIGNMHRKIRKDRLCGSGDMLADRQLDTQTYSSQYFYTTPTGEVMMVPWATAFALKSQFRTQKTQFILRSIAIIISPSSIKTVDLQLKQTKRMQYKQEKLQLTGPNIFHSHMEVADCEPSPFLESKMRYSLHCHVADTANLKQSMALFSPVST